jgi:prophage regulatory protein
MKTAPSTYRLLRLPTVLAIVGVGRSTLYSLIASGKFPPGIRLTDSGRAVAWSSIEIEQWVSNRINKAGGSNGKQ